MRDGKPVIGYGFCSNGRYAQSGVIRERLAPRILEADPAKLRDEAAGTFDPHAIWTAMMSNEKPGGHGDRAFAAGGIDMAVWDATAKILGKPLWTRSFGPLQRRQVRRARAGLLRRRLLLPRQGEAGPAGRDAPVPRSRLPPDEDEDRRRTARRRTCSASNGRWRLPAPARTLPSMPMAASISTPRSPTRAPWSAMVSAGSRSPSSRSTIRRTPCSAMPRHADRDRREPVLGAGLPQPRAPRRHAPAQGLAAARPFALLRPDRDACAFSTWPTALAGRGGGACPHGGHQLGLNMAAGPAARRHRELSRRVQALRRFCRRRFPSSTATRRRTTRPASAWS